MTMKTLRSAAAGLVLCIASACASAADAPPPYASARPLREATLFAPGVVSGGDYDSHPAFTPDGRTLYFVRSAPDFRFWTILVTRYEHGRWTTPEVAPFSGRYSDADPFITADGSRFYFISKRPVNGRLRGDTDIWVMHRTATGWSEPENPGAPLNSDKDEYYPTVAADGTLYFGSERPGGHGANDLYSARPEGNGHAQPENLGDAINTAQEEYEPYIAPDRSFLIFMACGRADSLGQCDLYLSRREGDGWATPKNLGPKINSAGTEYSPKLSPDGRYFFWTSARNRFTTQPLPERVDYAGLMKLYHGPGNGLPDIFQIDAAELGIGASH